MSVDIYVVIDIHTPSAPVAEDESRLRQRAQRRLVDSLEELETACAIGLHRTIVELVAELVGAKHYDPHDGDWACEEAFSPKERYCALPWSRAEVSWQVALEKVTEEVRRFLASSEGTSSFLGQAEAVTVGFDDGELVRVKSLS